MKRFQILDDDGFAVGTISARSKTDAEQAASGRQVRIVQQPRKQTHAERYRSAMAAAGPAPF